MSVTTRPLRQEVAYLPGNGWGGGDRDDGVGSGPIVTDFDTGAYFRPEVGDKILVGGLEPDCDYPLHFCAAPEEANPSLTEDHTNLQYRCSLRLPKLPPGFGAGGAQGIVSCYDVTEDWTPSTFLLPCPSSQHLLLHCPNQIMISLSLTMAAEHLNHQSMMCRRLGDSTWPSVRAVTRYSTRTLHLTFALNLPSRLACHDLLVSSRTQESRVHS